MRILERVRNMNRRVKAISEQTTIEVNNLTTQSSQLYDTLLEHSDFFYCLKLAPEIQTRGSKIKGDGDYTFDQRRYERSQGELWLRECISKIDVKGCKSIKDQIEGIVKSYADFVEK